MGDFLMPSLGADMESGTVLEWRVHPGDVVHKGDIVALVDTDKSDIEVEVFEEGTIEELLVEVGCEVAVGTPLARIASTGPSTAEPAPPAAPEPTTAPAAPAPPKRARKKAAPPARQASRPPAPSHEAPSHEARSHEAPSHVRASPLARRRAAEQGVELAGIAGSGPEGAVLAADVVEPASGRAAPAPADRTRRDPADRQRAMREAIGALMARSKREIPHYYLATTIDLSSATAWLAEQNAQRAVTERLLPAALLLKATALAAREVPSLNGFWDEGFQAAPSVHLGVAVSLRGGGLVAPAIHDADRLSLDDLMASLRDLVERTRSGRLRSSEMSDPTITVTNLGERGAEEVYGVIYPPQVAVVGFGSITERPWASGGLLGVRPIVRATLAADHRATDGHEGSRFLAAIDRLLHEPEGL